MLMYHVNFGYPLLDEGAELLLPREYPASPGAAATRARMAVQPGPAVAPAADELLDMYIPPDREASPNMYSCGVINDRLRGGLALEVTYDPATLPYLQVWRNLSEGIYVLALEPGTHPAKRRAELEQSGAIAHLQPGQTVDYRLTLEAHIGGVSIAEMRKRYGGT
jgi:hypothetical protein